MKSQLLRRVLMQVTAKGGTIIFLLVALEVVIMISPFALFFYSVFSPVFNWLDQFAATRWLTTFFLPHMVLPPTVFLRAVRILGSVLFLAGMGVFAICAAQVYLGKILKRGVATRGLYRYIRHPQYLALGAWGLGMGILWPRFIVLACLSGMFVLYYYLAKDEEKRMELRFGEKYREYEQRTGRFFPRSVEQVMGRLGRILPKPLTGHVAAAAWIIGIVIGTGFLLREVTLKSLPFQAQGNITLLPILPEDQALSAGVLSSIATNVGSGEAGDLAPDKDYLGYLMPVDYIMQGMIADTGSDSHLFEHHQTFGMITDWVLHPFEHLRRSPSAQMAAMHGVDPAVARRHHCPLGIADDSLRCEDCPYRRIILVEVDHDTGVRLSGSDTLSLGSTRVPVEAIDINTQTGQIVKITKLGKATAWKGVPTPGI